MKRFSVVISAITMAVVLAGCSTISKAPAGPIRIAGAQATLGRDWSDVTKLLPATPSKVRLLSIDGPLLNRLYISGGLAKGDFLVKPASKAKPTPVIREAMSMNERIEFVTDSVAAMDYQRVESARPRPATFNGKPAIRFDINARTSEGLDVLGTALVSEVAGKTYVIIYLAPAEHYFQSNLAEVEQVMNSARPVG